MNQLDLETDLKNLPLGGIRFFQQIASTNEEAARWIKTGCPDLALVVADEQTAGRGRNGRNWFTPAGSALAFSLVLHPVEPINQLLESQITGRLNGLGALAVCKVLQNKYQLPAKIKWPNDVLVNGGKLAGVLVEAHWIGNEFATVVLGIGINVATTSIPPVDWDALNPNPVPATCIETVLGETVNRSNLLYDVLEDILVWREQLSGQDFLQAWQQNLAFWNEWVQIIPLALDSNAIIGRIIALEEDGALLIQEKSGKFRSMGNEEIHPSSPPFGGFRLRPVDSL